MPDGLRSTPDDAAPRRARPRRRRRSRGCGAAARRGRRASPARPCAAAARSAREPTSSGGSGIRLERETSPVGGGTQVGVGSHQATPTGDADHHVGDRWMVGAECQVCHQVTDPAEPTRPDASYTVVPSIARDQVPSRREAGIARARVRPVDETYGADAGDGRHRHGHRESTGHTDEGQQPASADPAATAGGATTLKAVSPAHQPSAVQPTQAQPAPGARRQHERLRGADAGEQAGAQDRGGHDDPGRRPRRPGVVRGRRQHARGTTPRAAARLVATIQARLSKRGPRATAAPLACANPSIAPSTEPGGRHHRAAGCAAESVPRQDADHSRHGEPDELTGSHDHQPAPPRQTSFHASSLPVPRPDLAGSFVPRGGCLRL